MRQKFTESQIDMLIQRAERQLLQIVASAASEDPAGKHIPKTSHATLHDTVVSLVTLFRDDMCGAADVATRIAKQYANGVDAKAGAPTLASVHAILSITRNACKNRHPRTASGADGG